jgi:hypothetical protein
LLREPLQSGALTGRDADTELLVESCFHGGSILSVGFAMICGVVPELDDPNASPKPGNLPPLEDGLRRLVLEDLGVGAHCSIVQIGAGGWRATDQLFARRRAGRRPFATTPKHPRVEAPCDLLLVLDYDDAERLAQFTVVLDEGTLSAQYVLEGDAGSWSAPMVSYVDQDGNPTKPSKTKRERLTLDRHKKRIAALISTAGDLDEIALVALPPTGLRTPLRELLKAWQIREPTTRHAERSISQTEVSRYRSEGWAEDELALQIGVQPKSIAENARRRRLAEAEWQKSLAQTSDPKA